MAIVIGPSAIAIVIFGCVSYLGGIVIERQSVAESPQARCENANNCNEKDLQAQIRVANASEIVVDFSAFQMVLSVLGIGLLGWTLLHTATSAYSAQIAAEAAVRSISVAQKTAHQQLRAYFLVESTSIEIDEIGVAWMFVNFRNSGQTPALDINVSATMSGHIDGEGRTFGPSSKFSIGPGGSLEKPIGPIPPPETAALQAGAAEAFVWGEATYRDIFGRNHFSRFRMQIGGKRGFFDRSGLSVCREGNYQDEDEYDK